MTRHFSSVARNVFYKDSQYLYAHLKAAK